MMNEADFNQAVEQLIFSVEESIDRSHADIDYENTAGMLTLTCEGDGSQIIISRQPSIGEVWLAARSGGFHFKLQAIDGIETWCNTVTGKPLSDMLSEVCLAQSGESIHFDF